MSTPPAVRSTGRLSSTKLALTWNRLGASCLLELERQAPAEHSRLSYLRETVPTGPRRCSRQVDGPFAWDSRLATVPARPIPRGEKPSHRLDYRSKTGD